MSLLSILFPFTGVLLIVFGIINALSNTYWGTLSIVTTLLGMLFIVAAVVLKRKEYATKFAMRSTQYMGNAVATSLLVVSLLVVMNFFLSHRRVRYDVTAIQQFTLADQTIQVLKGLKNEVRIYAFHELQNRFFFDYIFKEYGLYSPKIEYTFVDPDKEPRLAQRFDITSYGDVIFETDVRKEKVFGNEEQTLTNALIKVTREYKKKIYYVTGHGERDFDDFTRIGYETVRDRLIEQNYILEKIDLIKSKTIPEDCSVIVINAPSTRLFGEELLLINTYVNEGGKVFFLLEPPPAPGFADFFEKWGVIIGNDLVLDGSGSGRMVGMDKDVPLISSYSNHEIVNRMGGQNTFFPTSRSVTPAAKMPQLVDTQSLVATTVNSWGETEFNKSLSQVQFNPGSEKKGPLSLGVVISKRFENAVSEDPMSIDKRGNIVVVGDVDFASNLYSGHLPNANLYLNVINWLAEEDDLVSIPAKNPEDRRVTMTDGQAKNSLYLTVFLLPCLILLSGMIVFIRRKGM